MPGPSKCMPRPVAGWATIIAYFIQRTGLMDWTCELDSRRCVDKKSNCKIQIIMMTVISILAQQD